MKSVNICFVMLISLAMMISAIEPKSHYGKEFYIGMVPNFVDPVDVILDIAAESPGRLEIQVTYLNISLSHIFQKGVTHFNVNKSIIHDGTFQGSRAIWIRTNVSVALYVTSYRKASSATYLALPIDVLDTEYTISSFKGSEKMNASVLMIIATRNNTHITLLQNTAMNSSFITRTIHLNVTEVYQLMSLEDLTNTRIVSDKPVAVIAGSSCAEIPLGVSSCSMLLEQMLPEVHSSDTFIVPPIFPRTGYIIQVRTYTKNAYICFRNRTKLACDTIRNMSSLTYLTSTEPTIVTSDTSIHVIQYGLSHMYDNVSGDPFMATIPGLKQYLNIYRFVVPDVYIMYNNYIAIMIPSTKDSDLLLDGVAVQSRYKYSVSTTVGNYIVLLLNINIGYHELKHSDINVKFGVIVYGLDNIDGYGFPAGLSLEYPATPVNLSAVPVSCFSCDNLLHLELCDTVTTCSPHEVCFTERYLLHGQSMFRTGCKINEACPSHKTSDRCVECCSGNYCNGKGCGDPGLPGREERGPMCFDCDYALTPNECHSVTLCGKDQFCSVQEIAWGAHSLFKMGCYYELCRQAERTSSGMHIRSTTLCSSCCADDFCNLNCTHGSTNGQDSPIIG